MYPTSYKLFGFVQRARSRVSPAPGVGKPAHDTNAVFTYIAVQEIFNLGFISGF